VLPALIVHADWSADPKKRWMCTATFDRSVYRLSAPSPVRNPEGLVQWAKNQANSASAVLGFDFPIGVPAAYARKAGIDSFLDVLPQLGHGRWKDFFNLAERPHEVSIERPFYPQRPGGALQSHLVEGIGVRSIDELLRQCDFGAGDRNKACALFWTLGGNQVGRAAISGWRGMLIPAMRSIEHELGVWPFQGDLKSLLASKSAVVVETYPGDACVQLGLGAPGRGWSKRNQMDRIHKGHALRRVATQMRIDLRHADVAISDGFGASDVAEDQFDSVVGLLGMLAVVLGVRNDGAPQEETVRSTEGWILGQRNTPIAWAS
jgi:hypothetical protein